MVARSHVTAFQGHKRIASGDLANVARVVREALDRDERTPVLVFDDATSQIIDLDVRGTPADVAQRYESRSAAAPVAPEAERRRGRPKLGVVAREVTLLPRHWEWLAGQPGGASVALRKLVEHAIKSSRDRDAIRRAQDATYRFVSAMAGNEAGYEEAIRALFAGDRPQFDAMISSWPRDVRLHAVNLAAGAFPPARTTE